MSRPTIPVSCFLISGFVALSGLAPLAQAAGAPCNSLASCLALQKSVTAQIDQFLKTDLPPFEDPVRRPDGKLRALSQNGATQLCAARGSHLPSAREFARLAMSQGAVGIRETAFPGVDSDDPRVAEEIQKAAADHFIAIYKQDYESEKVVVPVDFYYNRAGYVNHSGVDATFATSTVGSDCIDCLGSSLGRDPEDDLYVFDSSDGKLDDFPGSRNVPFLNVRCVSGR